MILIVFMLFVENVDVSSTMSILSSSFMTLTYFLYFIFNIFISVAGNGCGSFSSL